MKTTTLVLAATAALACAAPAQERAGGLYRKWVQVSHTSRFGVQPGENGYAGITFESGFLRGLAMRDVGGSATRRINSMQVDLQDNNAMTQEPTRVQIRIMRNGQPGTLLADIVFESGDFTLPQQSGTRAYRVDVDFGGAPVDLPSDDLFFGARMPANGSYPSDGLSLHAGHYSNYSVGDNPHPSAPSHGWGAPDGRAPVQPERSTPGVGYWSQSPVFQLIADVPLAFRRGPNPAYGFAGNYPNVARGDGLGFWFEDQRAAGGLAYLFMALSAMNQPWVIPALDGGLWLDPLTIVMIASAQVPSTGQLELRPSALRAGQLPPQLRGLIWWQMLTLLGGRASLSNAEVTKFH